MKSELIKRAESLLKTNNTAYSPAKLAEIIEAGTIPNGATLAVSGNQTVKLENDTVICYVDGKPAKTTPVVDAMRGTILVQYAVMASAISTGTGIK